MDAPAPNGSLTTHDVFISYSRKDRGFALLLEKALKAWRLPRELAQSQRHLDAFRDESDFTGSSYYAAIEQHLQRSRKLIVICSPAARASAYVGDEIRRFVRLHGADAVIPLLLTGVPNNEAGPDREAEMAFPGALCEALEMPLATSYLGFDAARDRPDKGAFEGAWYQLLANILDRSRSEIEQRDKRRQVRRWRIIAGVATSVNRSPTHSWSAPARRIAAKSRHGPTAPTAAGTRAAARTGLPGCGPSRPMTWWPQPVGASAAT